MISIQFTFLHLEIWFIQLFCNLDHFFLKSILHFLQSCVLFYLGIEHGYGKIEACLTSVDWLLEPGLVGLEFVELFWAYFRE